MHYFEVFACHTPPYETCMRPTDSRSRAPNEAPRDTRYPPPTRTSTRPTGIGSRAPTAALRGARPSPPSRTPACPTGSRSRATTAAPRGAHHLHAPSTSNRSTGSRLRAAPSTLRAVRSSPLPYKGILHGTGDLAVAGATARLNIRVLRHDVHQAPKTEAPSPPPCRASRGSPLAAVRDLRGRRNAQF